MGTYTEAVQKLYVAYFSRPADAAGLAYWEGIVGKNGGSTAAVSAAFAGSQEYKDTYAGMDESQVVNAVYRNLFGRDAEPEGRAYWAQGLVNKNFTIDSAVTTIAAGAKGSDAIAYRNKVAAATAFTGALDTTIEILGYVGHNANNAAKSWLAGITTDASLIAAIEATALDASIKGVITFTGSSGKSFSLTNDVDRFVGTAANDNFLAVSGAGVTLTQGDTLEGGAGTDTLAISSTVNGVDLGVASIANVEELSVSLIAAPRADGLIDLNNVAFEKASFTRVRGNTGINNEFVVDNANAGTSFVFEDTSNIAVAINYSHDSGAVSLTLKGYADEDRDDNNVTLSGATDLTLNLRDGNSIVNLTSADSSTVTVNVSGAATDVFGDVEFRDADAVTINAANNFLLRSAAQFFIVAGGATVTVTGAGNVTLRNLDGGNETVDASAMTGNLSVVANSSTVSVTGGAGKDNITAASPSTTIVAGDGDDYVNIKNNNYDGTSTSIKTVSGGAGFDTVRITAGPNLTANLMERVTGFERLAIADAWGAYDLSVADFVAVVFDSFSYRDVTLNNVTDETITFASAVGSTTTINAKDLGDFSLSLAGARDVGLEALSVNNVETLTIVSNTDPGNVAGRWNLISSLSTDADKLVISGNYKLSIAFDHNNTIQTIDASASNGLAMESYLEGKGGANGVEIIGSAKQDNILIGYKNDLFREGTGSAVNAGQGADMIAIWGTGAVDTITYQKGDSVVGYLHVDGKNGLPDTDVISFDLIWGFNAAAEDKLDLSAFGFTSTKRGGLSTGNGANAADVIAFIKGEASSITNFYTNGGIQRAVAAVSGDFTPITMSIGGADTATVVFIDSNGDGALSSGDDAIMLVGTAAVDLADFNF